MIDFRLAGSESTAEWERFLADLYKRGLTGEGLDMICVDGGKGLIAALPMVYDKIPVQRCWAHKIRNILNKVRKADEAPVKAGLYAVMNADTAAKARSAARRCAERWGEAYPPAVACLRKTSTSCSPASATPRWPNEGRSGRPTPSNAFVEVRRRARPMGVFQDRTSMDRILFAVLTHENKMQGIPILLQLTHNL